MEKVKSKSKNVLKIIGNVITGLIIVLVIYLALEIIIGFISHRPPCIFGHYIFVVVTNSMEPNIQVGDVVFVQKVDYSLITKGDIISFLDINPLDKVYGQYVTHRVFSINDLGALITKGDNNPSPDAYAVTSDNFLGRVDYVSHFLGVIISIFTSNSAIIFIIIIVALFGIIALEVKNFLHLKKKYDDEKEKEKIKNEILKEIDRKE